LSYLNLCRSCGCDFASVSAFDRHRVGVHEYTYSEGLKLEPPREDGRRCMDADELAGAGMERDPRGRWRIAADAERARRAFAEAA
jgi:hypothetical protein